MAALLLCPFLTPAALFFAGELGKSELLFWGIFNRCNSNNMAALGIVAPGNKANTKTPPHLKE
jgi:hypothetical protein